MYGPCFREFDGICQQVVYDLLDTVHIAMKHDIRILEIAKKKDALVVHHMRKACGDTLQQIVQVERHVVAGLLGIVKTIHVQQVVQKM